MAMMDVFSDGGGSGSGAIKSASFTWDSTTDGNITSPNASFIFGQIGTAGKEVAILNAVLQRKGIDLNLGGPIAPNGYELFIAAGSTILFQDNGLSAADDEMVVDGTAFSVSLPTPPAIATGIAGGSDVEFTITSPLPDPGDTWDVEGRYVVVLQYIELDV